MRPVLIHRGNTYKTESNRRVKVLTPGKKLINIKIGKKAKIHRCHECNQKLLGIVALRSAKFSRQKVSQRRISRPLGATHCSNCVARKITTEFFANESKVINK